LNKTIVVLQDEYLDREDIAKFLKREFPRFNVLMLGTEAEFHSVFPQFIAAPPALALLDMRGKWTYPAPEMLPPPPEVLAGTGREVGARCWKMLRGNPRTAKTPVIFYTLIDERRTAGDAAVADPLVKFVEKGGTDREVIAAMRKFLQGI
jgi:DNA-binding NarL/FixJ family response regulator